MRLAQAAAKANNFSMEMRIMSCKNVLELAKLPGLRYEASENLLICNDCYLHSTSDQLPRILRGGSSATLLREAGVFKGPLAAGPLAAERPFRVVKFAVKQHICSALHDWCTSHAVELARINDKGRQAGIMCSKVILQGVKKHDSDSSYEERITMLDSAGVQVGSKNHSRMFVPRLRNSMHVVITGSMQKAFTTPMEALNNRPVPFCLSADKATLDRQTGQMHGAILLIEGELRALMLSVLPAPDSTGKGLADTLVTVVMDGKPLRLSKSLLRHSSTGLAFDGQYQSEHEGHTSGLSVKQHYCKTIDLNPDYVISRWDGAHRVELGMDEVRKQIEFYGALAVLVSTVQSKFLYGKSLDRVMKTVERLSSNSLRLCAIGVICTTRFCWSERRVYKNFLGNLVTFIEDLVSQDSQKADDIVALNKVRSITFVIQVYISPISPLYAISPLYLPSIYIPIHISPFSPISPALRHRRPSSPCQGYFTLLAIRQSPAMGDRDKELGFHQPALQAC